MSDQQHTNHLTPRTMNSPASVGRNNPCPCGSGKKYKKCCMERDAAAKASQPSIDWQKAAARPAAAEHAGMGGHPYAMVKMVTNPSPDLLSQLSERAIAALKDKWSITKVARLETSEIVSRLEKLGIDGHQAAFVVLTDGRTSAWSIGKTWMERLSLPGDGDVDFVCLAACELWKRYCPERPSMEMLDDWLTEGYDLCDARKNVETVEIWLRVWEHVRPRIEPHMTTFEAADAVFQISQFFGNWIQDFTMEIHNAAIDDKKYAEIGIQVIHEVLDQFVDESLNTVLNFRCELGTLLFSAGRCEEGDAALQAVIREHPDQACGYAELSSALGCSAYGMPDYPRAIAILEQALAYPVVDADDWDLGVRLDDLRENLRAPTPE